MSLPADAKFGTEEPNQIGAPRASCWLAGGRGFFARYGSDATLLLTARISQGAAAGGAFAVEPGDWPDRREAGSQWQVVNPARH